MLEFIKIIFEKYIVIFSYTYQILKYRSKFYTLLQLDKGGALKAFKYFIEAHLFFLSLISAAHIFEFDLGYFSLIDSEIYIFLSIITTVPQLVGIKMLSLLTGKRIDIIVCLEIVFYGSAFYLTIIPLSLLVFVIITFIFLQLFSQIGIGAFSIWHWLIVISFCSALAAFQYYVAAWIKALYGIKKRYVIVTILSSGILSGILLDAAVSSVIK